MSKTHRAEKTYHAPQVAGDDTWTNNGWASWLHNTMEDLDREEYEPDNQQENEEEVRYSPEYVLSANNA